VWRERTSKVWEVSGGENFECPFGFDWGYIPEVKERPREVIVQQKIVVQEIEMPKQESKEFIPPQPPPLSVEAISTVHEQSGMVNYRGLPCESMGDSLGTEEKKCCGGRVRLIEVFHCAVGVQGGKVSREVCNSCGFYRAKEQ
jgi:hypothetical protein